MASGDRDGRTTALFSRLEGWSLLWGDAVSGDAADPVLAQDLRLPQLLERLTPVHRTRRTLEQLLAIPAGDADREERAAAISDFLDNPALGELVAHLGDHLAEVHTVNERESDRDILKLVWRLGDLALMVDAVDALRDAFAGIRNGLRSVRLRHLADLVAELDGDSRISRLRRDLPSIRAGLRERRSVTIGVNLDDRLRPREAMLLSVNDGEYESGGVLDSVGSALFGADNPYRARTPLHRNAAGADTVAGVETSRTHAGDTASAMPLEPLFRDLDELLRDVSRPLARAIKRYNAVSLSWLRRLVDELAVVETVARFARRLRDHGLPVTFAESVGDNAIDAEALYDPLLALERIDDGSPESIVRNDVRLFHDHPTVTVTGPNNGGKTTFLRAIGLAAVFSAAGCPVAADRLRLRPGVKVLTEFAGGESTGLDEGRFAHEAHRVAELLQRCDDSVLVLLNETFSSTAVSDALELSLELMEVIAARGGRAVVATHLHDLPRRGRAESLTIRPDEPFALIPGLPDGRSLAREVARRAGLDFDALKRGEKAVSGPADPDVRDS